MTPKAITQSLCCLLARAALGGCVLFVSHLPVFLAGAMLYRAMQAPDLAPTFVLTALGFVMGLDRWRSFYVAKAWSPALRDWVLSGRGGCPFGRMPD